MREGKKKNERETEKRERRRERETDRDRWGGKRERDRDRRRNKRVIERDRGREKRERELADTSRAIVRERVCAGVGEREQEGSVGRKGARESESEGV